MRTRIRYYQYVHNLITDWFTIGPNLIVRGEISSLDNSYTIRTFDSEILYTGTSNNLRYTKSKIRELLLSVGVKFEEEIRVI